MAACRRVAVACIVAGGALCAVAGDIASRKMAWAHYVGWTTPDNVSFEPRKSYAFPVHEKGTDPFRDEVKRAADAGLDGFFVDVLVERDRSRRPAFHATVGKLLDASRGTRFCVAPCLDVKTDAENQSRQICWLLETYGSHPNYPRMGNRYVVATFTHHEWSPDEWRTIRERCERAGYPIFIVGNVKPSCGLLEPSRLERYRDSFDVCYSFAYAGRETLPEDDENRANASWCKANGKGFMPCIHPGYLGSWLRDHNPAYQPHQGVDKYMRSLLSALEVGGDWLHFTTWNDLCETAMEARTLTPGDVSLMREAIAAFKGEAPRAKEADVLFAYHREELPGTLLRIEAMRLPSAEAGEVKVAGRLKDSQGNVVADLPAKTLARGWDRAEWLVNSAVLASSPHVMPVFAMRSDMRKVSAAFPALFFRTPWIENQVTVRATFADRMPCIDSSLSVSWKDGVVSSALSFKSIVSVRRAILFKNDRPIGQYGSAARGQATLPLFFESRSQCNLSVNGGTIRSSAAMEMGGNFYRAVVAEGAADAPFAMSFADGSSQSLTLSELAMRRVVMLEDGKGAVRACPDCTIRDAPTLDSLGGEFVLGVFDRAPAASDSYFVRFETADGRTAESSVVYPFAADVRTVDLPILESSVTLETLPGEEGLSRVLPVVAHSEFLSPQDERPVRGTAVVDAHVSTGALRCERWPLQTDGVARFGERHVQASPDGFGVGPDGRPGLLLSGNGVVKLPVREWPMDTADVSLDIAPEVADGVARTVIGRRGTGAAFTLRYLGDGRLEATWSGMGGGGVWNLKPARSHSLVSRDPMPVGKWTRVRLANDHRKIAMYFDGALQGETGFAAFRDYGQVAVSLGGGAADGAGFKGMISNLRIGACIRR